MPPPPSKTVRKPAKSQSNARYAAIKSAEKRLRQNLTSSSEHSSPESNHRSKMSETSVDAFAPLMETIKKMLHDNYTRLSTAIDMASESIKSDLGGRIDKLATELRVDIDRIDKKVDALSGSVDLKIESLSKEVDTCRNHIDCAEDDFLRVIRTSELKMIGLKHVADENLVELLSKIAALIGINFGGQTPSIVRATKWVKNEQVPQMIIIIKFLAPHLKEVFYKHYLDLLASKKQLTLDLLEIGSKNERLTIGENLTPHNHKLFAACMSLKKEGKIAQVHTSNGITNIKIKKGERAVAIKSQRDLDMFLANNQLQVSKQTDNEQKQQENASTTNSSSIT